MEIINKCINFLKKNLLWVLCAVMAIYLVNGFCQAIDLASSGLSFVAICSALTQFVYIAIFAFGLYAFVKGKKGLFKLFFTIYFSFSFVSLLTGFFNKLGEFSGSSALYIIYLVFNIFQIVAGITVGVLYIKDYVNEKNVSRNLINLLVALFVALEFFVFLFAILSVAVDRKGWVLIIECLLPCATAILFAAIYNQDDEKISAADVDSADSISSSSEEEVKDEDASNETHEADDKTDDSVDIHAEEVTLEEKPKKKRKTKKE